MFWLTRIYKVPFPILFQKCYNLQRMWNFQLNIWFKNMRKNTLDAVHGILFSYLIEENWNHYTNKHNSVYAYALPLNICLCQLDVWCMALTYGFFINIANTLVHSASPVIAVARDKHCSAVELFERMFKRIYWTLTEM